MSDFFNKIIAAAKTSKRLEQQRRNVAFAVHGAHMRDDDVGPARNDLKLPASSAQKLTGALAFKKLGQRQGSLTFDVHEADHAPVYIDLSQMSKPTSTQMSNPTSTQMSNPTSSNQETESSETNQSNNQAMTGGAPGQVDNADDKNSSDRNDGNSDNESDSGNESDASEDEKCGLCHSFRYKAAPNDPKGVLIQCFSHTLGDLNLPQNGCGLWFHAGCIALDNAPETDWVCRGCAKKNNWVRPDTDIQYGLVLEHSTPDPEKPRNHFSLPERPIQEGTSSNISK